MLVPFGDTNSLFKTINGNLDQQNMSLDLDLYFQRTDGWTRANEVWTYSSADDPTYTLTVTGDQTAKYTLGMRVKLTQATGGTKYFIITKTAYVSPNTTLTLYGGTDYDLANEVVQNPHFSAAKAPYGFPLDPTKWTVSLTDTSSRTAAATGGTWYNVGTTNCQLSIPIGAWDVWYSVVAEIDRTTAGADNTVQTALSATNNGASDASLVTYFKYSAVSGCDAFYATATQRKHLVLAAKTLYYLNGLAEYDGALFFRGDLATTRITAVSAYL